MGDEAKPPMPEQPATKEISAPTQESILLAEFRVGMRQLNARFDEVDNRLDSVETTQKILLDDGKSVKDRLIRVEMRQDEMTEWRARSSERVKGVDQKASQADMAHDAAIASLHTKVDGLEKSIADNTALSVELKTMIRDAAKSPLGQKLIGSLIALAIAAASGAAGYLQAKGH